MFDLSVIYKDVRKMLEGQEEKKETLKAEMAMFVESVAADIAVDRLIAAREAYAEALVEFDFEPNMKTALKRLMSIENSFSEQKCQNVDKASDNDAEWTLREWLKSLE